MIEEVLSPPPKLFFKRPADSRKKERQVIVELIGGNPAGLTRHDLAAALDSPINCVSVMISRINKELAEQGWKISSTDFERRQGRRGAPRRRYRLVRL